jgi:hypothetical protein
MPTWAPSFPSNPVDVRGYGTFATTAAAAVNTATVKAAVAAVYAAGGGDIFIPRGTTGYQMGRSTVGSSTIGTINLLPGVGITSNGAQLILSENCPIISARSTLSLTVTTTITVDTTAATTALTVASSTGFTVGDDVFIRIGQAAYDAAEPDWWLYATVLTIPDSTHITIDRPVGYAATVAPIINANKSITKVTEFIQNVSIDGLDLVNPMTGSANAEGGLSMTNARDIRVGRLTGIDTGSLISGQFCENVEVALLSMRRSTAQGGQASKGKGAYLAECRNWHFNSVRMKDIERDCFNIEGRTTGIVIDNLLFDNGFAGRSTTNVPVFKLLYYGVVSVGTLTIISNAT